MNYAYILILSYKICNIFVIALIIMCRKLKSGITKTGSKKLGNRNFRQKRNAEGPDKRLDYDRVGKRSLEEKRFADAMRLGKRGEGPGGSSSFVDAMRLGKRYADAMRLGKRSAMDTMRLGKRMQDAMRFGKRMDQMRLGKRSNSNILLDPLTNGKRMSDVMRLGKRRYQPPTQRIGTTESKRRYIPINQRIGSTAGKRMSDLMRLGKRGQSNEAESSLHEVSEDMEKRMSDLMRLGKRPDIVVSEPEKRMSDLMRLGKRLSYDRYGKRAFMDEMRMGKRAFMDDMRMGKRWYRDRIGGIESIGKRMGDVMRLGKRIPDAMRLGKRGGDQPEEYQPVLFENDSPHGVNMYDYEDADGAEEEV